MLLPAQIQMIRAWSNGNTIFLGRRHGKTHAIRVLKKIGKLAVQL